MGPRMFLYQRWASVHIPPRGPIHHQSHTVYMNFNESSSSVSCSFFTFKWSQYSWPLTLTLSAGYVMRWRRVGKLAWEWRQTQQIGENIGSPGKSSQVSWKGLCRVTFWCLAGSLLDSFFFLPALRFWPAVLPGFLPLQGWWRPGCFLSMPVLAHGHWSKRKSTFIFYFSKSLFTASSCGECGYTTTQTTGKPQVIKKLFKTPSQLVWVILGHCWGIKGE